MNLSELHNKLIAAAKTEVLDDRVPHAFEKRVTALITARIVPDELTLWVRGLWRAAVSCVVICLLLGTWTIFSPASTTNAVANDDLSQNFVNTLLASVDSSDTAP